MIGGAGTELNLSALALRGAGVGNELETGGQQNLLLNILPADVECGRVERQTMIEPGGLRADLVIPQRVRFEAAGVVEREIGVDLCQSRDAVIGRAGRPRRGSARCGAGPRSLLQRLSRRGAGRGQPGGVPDGDLPGRIQVGSFLEAVRDHPVG